MAQAHSAVGCAWRKKKKAKYLIYLKFPSSPVFFFFLLISSQDLETVRMLLMAGGGRPEGKPLWNIK